jgi:S1-C subfamily serine protease
MVGFCRRIEHRLGSARRKAIFKGLRKTRCQSHCDGAEIGFIAAAGKGAIEWAVPAYALTDPAHRFALDPCSKLLADGKVEHAFLGVGIQTIPSALAGQLGEAAGAAVTDVRPGTPAQSAGLHEASGQKTIQGVPYATGGDVITKIDGTRIATDDALRRAVDAHQPGDKVTLTYVRNGKTRTATVTLGTRPSS